MNGTEWNTKEEKIQRDFLWALGLNAAHQIPQSEYRTDSDIIKIDKIFKLYNRHYLPKSNKYNSQVLFSGETNRYRNTRRPLGEFNRIRKRMRFSEFSTEILTSKFIASIIDWRLHDNMLKEKYLDVPKIVEQMQNTCDWKNEKNTIPEALIGNWEKSLKKNLYTEKHKPEKNKTNRKRDQTNEIVDTATHQTGIRTINVQP